MRIRNDIDLKEVTIVFGFKKIFVNGYKDFSLNNIFLFIKAMRIDWFSVGAVFVGAVAAGFLCTKYFKDIAVWLLIVGAALILLDYAEFIVIRWDAVKAVLGTSPAATLDGMLKMSFLWAQQNIPSVISFVIGFTIGIKVG